MTPAPETTDLIERLNKRAENGRVFHADRKLFAEAAAVLSEKDRRIVELERHEVGPSILRNCHLTPKSDQGDTPMFYFKEQNEDGTFFGVRINLDGYAIIPKAEIATLRARLASCEAALEEMTPHVATIERAIRINDEWGRVIVGQTEAAAEIARIHSAALTKGGEDA